MIAQLIHNNYPDKYSPQIIKGVLKYYELLLEGNKTQNLTRIISEDDFFYHNFLDCHFLGESKFLQKDKTHFDIGSGGGVPGILSAILFPESKWILCESEKKKADFLKNTVESLQLKNIVFVTNERAEVFLNKKQNQKKEFIPVLRAVGSILKIVSLLNRNATYNKKNLLENSSTWNNMILFKGPLWTKEWEEYSRSKFKIKLEIENKIEYSSLEKKRIILCLKKVPRGTFNVNATQYE